MVIVKCYISTVRERINDKITSLKTGNYGYAFSFWVTLYNIALHSELAASDSEVV